MKDTSYHHIMHGNDTLSLVEFLSSFKMIDTMDFLKIAIVVLTFDELELNYLLHKFHHIVLVVLDIDQTLVYIHNHH